MPRGLSAAIDEMFTIAPPSPLSIIAGMACFAVRNIASTLTRITRSHRLCVSATTVSRLAMPTLLSRTSTRPNRASAASTIAAHWPSSVRSASWAAASAPSDAIIRTVPSARSSDRSTTSTFAPARARRNGRRAAVADAVARRATARDDGDLPFQCEIRMKIGVHRESSRRAEIAG